MWIFTAQPKDSYKADSAYLPGVQFPALHVRGTAINDVAKKGL